MMRKKAMAWWMMAVLGAAVVAEAGLADARDFAPRTRDARPVSHLSATGAVLNYETPTAVPTRIQLREGTYPGDTPGHDDAWEDPRVIEGDPTPKRQHCVVLEDLEPGTRYYYRVYDPGSERESPGKWCDAAPWSREYAFATLAKEGERAVVRIPVKVLIVPNAINLSTVTEGAPLPEPMSDEELELYRTSLEQTVLFYWVNSHMRYWVDLEIFVEPEWQRIGAEREDLPEFYQGWPAARDGLRVFDPEDISNHAAGAPLKDKRIWTGQVVFTCERRWDDNGKRWFYQGSGGGTFGIDWMNWGDKSQLPAPGRSSFLGGSDIAWLMCHEFRHQVESQYYNSGLTTEDDRAVFCHFSPAYVAPQGDWGWDTAFAHGEHWDGITWEFRMFTDAQWLRNMFGEIVTVADRDGDGFPDADTRLPLDEERFGTDARELRTDGVTDDLAKVMVAKWVPSTLTNLRERALNPGYEAMWKLAHGKLPAVDATVDGYAWPDPRMPDSDRDGVIDPEDPYPIYPWEPVVRKAEITVDGDLADWADVPVCGHLKANGVELTIKTAHNVKNLCYAVEVRGDWRSLTIQLDGDADGWYAGNDNYQIGIEAGGSDGPKLGRAIAHLCSNRRWPHWDDGNPIRWKNPDTGDEYEWVQPKRFQGAEALTLAGDVDGEVRRFELAIPNGTGATPIQAGAGHPIGLAVYVRPAEGGSLSVYEPYTLFVTEWE